MLRLLLAPATHLAGGRSLPGPPLQCHAAAWPAAATHNVAASRQIHYRSPKMDTWHACRHVRQGSEPPGFPKHFPAHLQMHHLCTAFEPDFAGAPAPAHMVHACSGWLHIRTTLAASRLLTHPY